MPPERQEIEFVIKPDGTVEERVTGVAGPDCEKVGEAIEAALGEITERERSSEYYDTAQNTDDTVVTST
jgi:hypothetical protein